MWPRGLAVGLETRGLSYAVRFAAVDLESLAAHLGPAPPVPSRPRFPLVQMELMVVPHMSLADSHLGLCHGLLSALLQLLLTPSVA